MLVGICGGTGSGKTAVAEALQARLSDRCCVLSQDSYYLDRSGWTERESDALSFDEPRSLDLDRLNEDVRALAAGRSIEVPSYCFATHCRLPDTRRQDAADVVLVEGTLIFCHPALRDAFDVRVFLDVPADVRLARRLRRDVRERGRTPESVVSQYLTTVRPMHERYVAAEMQHAHRVLDGLGSSLDEIAQACIEEIERRRRR